MRFLVDSQLLLWAVGEPERLSARARKLFSDPQNELMFSAASLWEIAIKASLGRTDFQVDARVLFRTLLDKGYEELPVTSRHAMGVDALPSLHKDPFDRLLLAQALAEGLVLLTTDSRLAEYPGPVRKV